jgi:hypothetical protein
MVPVREPCLTSTLLAVPVLEGTAPVMTTSDEDPLLVWLLPQALTSKTAITTKVIPAPALHLHRMIG